MSENVLFVLMAIRTIQIVVEETVATHSNLQIINEQLLLYVIAAIESNLSFNRTDAWFQHHFMRMLLKNKGKHFNKNNKKILFFFSLLWTIKKNIRFIWWKSVDNDTSAWCFVFTLRWNRAALDVENHTDPVILRAVRVFLMLYCCEHVFMVHANIFSFSDKWLDVSVQHDWRLFWILVKYEWDIKMSYTN